MSEWTSNKTRNATATGKGEQPAKRKRGRPRKDDTGPPKAPPPRPLSNGIKLPKMRLNTQSAAETPGARKPRGDAPMLSEEQLARAVVVNGIAIVPPPLPQRRVIDRTPQRIKDGLKAKNENRVVRPRRLKLWEI